MRSWPRYWSGSIPAGAGEPTKAPFWGGVGWVDPRGCGGADAGAYIDGAELGRSPRVRGSRVSRSGEGTGAGSIPAGAGEPIAPERLAVADQVDPRGCGGAYTKKDEKDAPEGRSPRVRGSHERLGIKNRASGSIPAGAGEPP